MAKVAAKLFEKGIQQAKNHRSSLQRMGELERLLLSNLGQRAFNDLKCFVCCFLSYQVPHMQFETLSIVNFRTSDVKHDFTQRRVFFRNSAA